MCGLIILWECSVLIIRCLWSVFVLKWPPILITPPKQNSFHRDCSIHIERALARSNTAWLYYIMDLIDFHSTNEIFADVHLKHSSFWASADAKPMSNGLLHAMPWQCMFALSQCLLQSLWFISFFILVISQRNISQAKKMFHFLSKKFFIYLLQLSIFLTSDVCR